MEMVINLEKPSMQGIKFLSQEFANRVQVNVRREAIDWRKILWENYGVTPHAKQAPVLDAAFVERKKVIIIRAGKRSGKTFAVTSIARTMHKAIPNARTWCCSGSYDLCDRVFDPLWNDSSSGHFGEIADRTKKDRRIRFNNGGLLQGKSWDDPNALEGESLDLNICDEAQTLDEDRFNLLYARTVDRGGLLILIGSPSASDEWFLSKCEEAKINPRWAYFEWTIWDNPYAPEEEIKQAQEDLTPEAFAEMFELKVRLPQGLVFSEYYSPTENIFVGEPHRKLPMEVWIDPGTTKSAYAVVFVQLIEMQGYTEVKIYDEIYEHHTTTEDVIHLAKQSPYWPQVTKGVMDVAGRAKHDNSYSPREKWQSLAKIPMHDQKVEILPGIDRHRTFLLQKSTGLRRLFIHDRCKYTKMEYVTWRFPKQSSTNVGTPRLPIDAFNHIMKAINYGLVYNFGYFDKASQKGQKKSRYL